MAEPLCERRWSMPAPVLDAPADNAHDSDPREPVVNDGWGMGLVTCVTLTAFSTLAAFTAFALSLSGF